MYLDIFSCFSLVLGGIFETFLEGSVDHVFYRNYIVNRRFFYLLYSGLYRSNSRGIVYFASQSGRSFLSPGHRLVSSPVKLILVLVFVSSRYCPGCSKLSVNVRIFRRLLSTQVANTINVSPTLLNVYFKTRLADN